LLALLVFSIALSLKDFSKQNGGNQPLNTNSFQRILKEIQGQK